MISTFSIAELFVSASSHSLALLADAGHLLSDSVALGIAILAAWIAQLPASSQATFGYRRVEILAALVNGVGLLAIALWIIWEAISRFQGGDAEILSLPMLITAIVGLVINSLNLVLLHEHSHQDLNLRGVFLHMLADAISSVGLIIAAILVWTMNWNWADTVISLFVSALIIAGSVPLIGQSLNILLERTPGHLDLNHLHTHLTSFEGVLTVDNLRVWAIALGQEALSAHLTVYPKDGEIRDRLLHTIKTSLQHEFGIQEIFLQMTSPVTPDLTNLSVPERLELITLPLQD